MPYPLFSLLKSFIYVFVLILLFLSLLHEYNFRIEVAAQLKTSVIISTGVWLKMSNTCLYGVQVHGTIHNIVALVIFFRTRMWSRLLRKRYQMLFVSAKSTVVADSSLFFYFRRVHDPTCTNFPGKGRGRKRSFQVAYDWSSSYIWPRKEGSFKDISTTLDDTPSRSRVVLVWSRATIRWRCDIYPVSFTPQSIHEDYNVRLLCCFLWDLLNIGKSFLDHSV